LEVNQSYPIAKLSAISKGVHANSMESDRADGLQKDIFLCKNADLLMCWKYKQTFFRHVS
jgi:hypothetical protein